MGLASIIGLYLVIDLEVRDLVAPFADEYRACKREVPQLIPNLGGATRFLSETFER